MLVLNTRPTIQPSEARVAEWMRNWTGRYAISGVAISSYHLPGIGTSPSQEADFVILTPQASAILEVKGTHASVTDGVITAEANGPWRYSEDDHDPVRTRRNDINPVDQVLNAAYLFKTLVGKHNPDHQFVSAVVVVVPPHGSTTRLRTRSMPTGCKVVLGNSGLRSWLHRSRRRDTIWTAQQAYSLLNAMNLGDQLTIPDLVAEGFPLIGATPHTHQTPRASSRAVTSSPPRPTVTEPASPFGPRTASAAAARDDSSSYDNTPAAAPPRRTVGRRRHGRQQLAALVSIAVIWAVIWLLVHHYYEARPSTPADTHQQITSTEHHPQPSSPADVPLLP
ncbi:nuclease-related domain-containing protein [Nocardia gipuzkoensis]